MSEESAITALEISKVYKNGNVGLHKSSFNIPKNSLVAILGPSGCGKSTLLKSLNGYSQTTTGEVYINSIKLVKENFDLVKEKIGYVPQDDTIYGDLSVFQNLFYAAKLRLSNKTDDYKNQKINLVLSELGIAHLKNRKVKDLSGGQRKRACISMELLTDPEILFLDEPTSPLDPQTISDFLKRLQKLTEKGTTVLMVTHKPEDLKYMDYAMFLAEGGEIAYFGNTSNYNVHFETDNVLEIYKNLSGNNKTKWIEKYNSIKQPTNLPKDDLKKLNKNRSIDYVMQLFWLTIRGLSLKVNDLGNLLLLIAQAPLIALLMVLVFDEINEVVVFFIIISSIWFGTNNAAREIIGEINIYTRERMFNVSIFPYLFSKISVLGIIAFIQSVLFSYIIYLAFEDNVVQWISFTKSTIWLFFVNVTGAMMGLLISSMVSNSEKAMSLVPITLIPQIILGGVIVKIDNIFIELLSYLTIARWGTTGLSKIQTEIATINYDIKLVSGVPQVEKSGYKSVDTFDHLTKNFHENFIYNFSVFENDIKIDLFFISSMCFFFFIAIFLSLKDKDRIA